MAKTITYQIKIAGTQEQVKALTNVEIELKKITKERNILIKSAVDYESRVNKLTDEEKQKYEEIKQKLGDLGNQIKSNQATRTNLNKEIKNTSTLNQSSAGSYERLTAQIAKERKELKQLGDPLGKNRKEFDRLTKSIKSSNDKLKEIDEAQGVYNRNVGNYAGGIKSAFKGIGFAVAGVTAVIAGLNKVFGKSIQVQKEFEFQMSKVGAVSKATSKELDTLQKDALRLGSSTEKTASEVAGLQENLARLGFNPDQIIAATEDILDASTALSEDLGQTAKVTAQNIRAFGLEAEDAGMVADVFAEAAASSALDLSKLDVALQKAAPVAKTFGFNVQDTTAFIGQLANAGLDASSAGTAFRNILLNLADSNGALAKKLGRTVTNGKELNEALIELRNSGVDLGEALELTDKRSVAAFSVFLDGAEDTNKLIDTLNNADGSAKRMADTMRDNLKGDTDAAKSAIEGLQIGIGAGLNPALRQATKEFTKIVQSINDWIKLSAADEIQDEKKQVNLLAAELAESNTSEERRAELINELNGISPDLVQGLDSENLSYEQLNKNLEEYNGLATERILLAGIGEEEAKAIQKQADATQSRVESELELRKFLQENFSTQVESGKTLEENADAILKANQNVFDQQKKANKNIFVQQANIAGLQQETANAELGKLIELRALYGVVNKTRKQQNETESNTLDIQERSAALQTQLIENQFGALDALELREQATRDLKKLEGDILSINQKFRTEAQSAILEQLREEIELRDQYDKAVKYGIIEQRGAYRELTENELAALKELTDKSAESVKKVGDNAKDTADIVKDEVLPAFNELFDVFDRVEKAEVKLPPIEFEDEEITSDALDNVLAGFEASVTGTLAILKQKFDSGLIDAKEYRDAVAEIFSPENSNDAVSGFINAFKGIKELFAQKDFIDKDIFKQQFKDLFADLSNSVLAFADIAGAVFENIAQIQDNKAEAELQQYESVQASKIEALDKRLESGAISEEQYNKQVTIIEEQTDKKQKELEYESAKRQRNLSIYNAAINGAGVILNAALTQPFIPAGLIATALASTLVGTQIAAIASQPLPQFATGGYIVQGAGTWNSDNQPALLSPLEAVINARSMQSNDVLSVTGTPRQIASDINSYKGYGVKFATGKAPAVSLGASPANVSNTINVNLDVMAEKIVSGINDKKVINVANETATVINRNNVINRAGDV